MRLKLTGADKQRLARRNTNDAEAYRSYLKGRYYWNKRTPEGIEDAISRFQQAIDEDPTYALAYAGLADAHVYRSFFNLARPRDAMLRLSRRWRSITNSRKLTFRWDTSATRTIGIGRRRKCILTGPRH